MADLFTQLTDQLTALTVAQAEDERRLADAKFGKKSAIRQAIRKRKRTIAQVTKRLRQMDKKDIREQRISAKEANGGYSPEAQKYMWTGITGVTDSVSSAVSAGFGEWGVLGKGKVGLAEQERLTKNPNGSPSPTSFFNQMDSKTWLFIGGFGLLVIMLISKKR